MSEPAQIFDKTQIKVNEKYKGAFKEQTMKEIQQEKMQKSRLQFSKIKQR